MEWYLFTIDVHSQLYYDKLINDTIALYGHLKAPENSFTFYKKIKDREAYIYLSIDDAVLARKFIDVFVSYYPCRDGKPKELDAVVDAYQPVM